MRFLFASLTLAAVAACAPEVPDSAAGVGFDDYDAFQAQRAAELAGTPPVPEGPVVGEETLGAVSLPAAGTGTGTAVADNAAISDEQDFDAVSARESIESDAARIAANREAMVVVQPAPLPDRPDADRPNIVAFALTTTNRVGQQVYSRSGLTSTARFQRNCARYASPDLAQEAFLAAGGPERDRRGLDPDGDGFACFWDPTPFRMVRGG